jgi:hypothetical protein
MQASSRALRPARAPTRSLESEILAVAVDPTRTLDLRALAERIAAMAPEVDQTDSTGLLHDDRRR